jgi:hypothetical protein
MKPNLGEASVAAGIDIDDRASLDDAGAELLRALGGRRDPDLARRGRHDALQAARPRPISRPPRRRSTT